MNPQQIEAACLEAIKKGGHRSLTLSTPCGQSLPHGFPRGTVLSENRKFVNRAYKPEHVLNWLRERGLTSDSPDYKKSSPC